MVVLGAVLLVVCMGWFLVHQTWLVDGAAFVWVVFQCSLTCRAGAGTAGSATGLSGNGKRDIRCYLDPHRGASTVGAFALTVSVPHTMRYHRPTENPVMHTEE